MPGTQVPVSLDVAQCSCLPPSPHRWSKLDHLSGQSGRFVGTGLKPSLCLPEPALGRKSNGLSCSPQPWAPGAVPNGLPPLGLASSFLL